MKPVYYRPFKLAVTALLMGASAVYLLIGDDLSALNMVLGVVMGIGAVAAGACGIDPRPALALDANSLIVRTTLRRRVVPLSDILRVSVESRMVLRHGLIPIGRREVLVIRTHSGMIGSHKFNLVGGTLALPPGGLRGVCATIDTLRRTASVSEEASTARSLAPEGEGGTGFDPDAAIARYLARKAEVEAEAGVPAPPVPAASPLPGPARVTFGRRVA